MTTPSSEVDDGDLAEQWAAATLSPADLGESPYERAEAPAETDPADWAEQALEVAYDEDDDR